MNKVTLLSIILPVLNEEKNILEIYRELKEVLDTLEKTYEIIFVDDGSTDRSFEVIKVLAHDDPSVKVIALSKNFGQTAALVSGIDNARGEITILMDADLQNDPRDIPRLLQKIEEGYDVVSGWRKNRKYNLFTRTIPSFFANSLISLLSGVRLHDYGCTLKAYRSKIIKGLKLYGEMHRFIPIYASWVGAKIAEIVVNHRPRGYGKSKYSLWRVPKVLLDLATIKFIAHYRTKPIYIFGGSGIIFILLSIICVIILLYNKFVKGISMIQSPLLILSALLIIIGVQSILMGLIAEMQMRTYFESLGKPTYHIREKINI